jgi:nucleoside-diphosphate-sugar epimerase
MGGLRPGRPLPADDLDFIVREAAGLWPQLRGARLFITGATGFFGRWLLEGLFAADERHNLGVRAVALSRDPDRFLGSAPHLALPGLGWVRGSVATLRPDALGGEAFDMVIHMATEADMQASAADPLAAADVITGGTRRTLEVAARAGARRFLFTSSGAVYGPQPPGMELIAEDYTGAPDPRDAASPYAIPGEAKRQAELLCAGRSGPETVIARGFSFAGPGLPLDGKFAFGNFIGDALGGGPIVIKGDGTALRSYLYGAELAVWLLTLLLRGPGAGLQRRLGACRQPAAARRGRRGGARGPGDQGPRACSSRVLSRALRPVDKARAPGAGPPRKLQPGRDHPADGRLAPGLGAGLTPFPSRQGYRHVVEVPVHFRDGEQPHGRRLPWSADRS